MCELRSVLVVNKAEKKEKKKKTEGFVSFDQLQAESEKLVAILKERETGMFTWHGLVRSQMKVIHDLIHPIFDK